MYAIVVKNGEGTWDVLSTIDYSASPEREQRLSDAIDSGKPIIGMITTPYQCLATNGAVWDGTTFSGGLPCVVPPEFSWEGINTYSLLCDNVIVASIINTANPSLSAMNDAAFSDPEGVTIVRVPSDISPQFGDVWTGENFVLRS